MENNHLLTNLNQIISELNVYKDVNREDIYEQAINKKLKETLLKYDSKLDVNSNYLLRRASSKVLKALTKMQKADDVEILIQNQLENTEEK